jgi:crotonobetainyl-CoA:carnitine CoA-transferase CaiB-like acyl-CoA transferase
MDERTAPRPPALQALIDQRGRDFISAVAVSGQVSAAPTRFKVGETVGSVIAAIGGVVADLVAARGGPKQDVSVDTSAAAASLASNFLVRLADGQGGFRNPPVDPNMVAMREMTQPWPTRDGRYFLPHLNLPELKKRVLGELGCEAGAAPVAAAVARRDAQDLETAIAAARACGGMIRSHQEWRAHPHGQALASQPVIRIDQIGDAPPEPIPGGIAAKGTGRPLGGLRVLDLTRILAGPVAARTLAEQGADVLMIAAEHLPQTPEHVRDTSHGKRSAFLDLTAPKEAEILRQLVRGADVFSQGYRPGVMARLGLSPDELARLRPGIVTLSVSCFGPDGPFADRAGWEQVAQAVTGLCATQGGDGPPELIPLPCCDYLTGYLGALGVLMALERRATEGGSYHVQVNLCRSAMFLQDQGLAQTIGHFPDPSDLTPWMVQSDGPRGGMRHLGPVARMSATPPHWARQSPLLGQDRPEWQ